MKLASEIHDLSRSTVRMPNLKLVNLWQLSAATGLLEIAINGGNAEISLGLKWGDVVEVQRFD